MQNGDSYRHLAKTCEEKARKEQQLQYRIGWAGLAETYRTLADQVEPAEQRTREKHRGRSGTDEGSKAATGKATTG